MSDFAIQVRDLSKRYMLRHAYQNLSLRETLTQAVHRCGRRLLSRGSEGEPNPTREEFWALRDLTFDVPTGETVAIVGPNGAGKSTLLKVLSRVTSPTTGRIEIAGRVASLLEVGTGFHPELTGRENVFLSGAILGMTRSEILTKFDEIVAFAGVENFIDTPVKRYSSGMYTRLAFAVSAHLDFEILIVDEVLSVGDAAFQAKSLNKMKQIMETGRTILFVSHNLPALSKFCRTGIYLDHGRIVKQGSITSVIDAYLGNKLPPQALLDLSQRRVRPRQVTITGGSLQQSDGSPTSEFRANETLRFQLEVEVSVPTTLSVEVRLRDDNNNATAYGPSGSAFDQHIALQPGRRRIEATVQLPHLASGNYALDVGLAENSLAYYDYLESGFFFSITPELMGRSNWTFRQAPYVGTILLSTTCRESA